MSVEQTGQTNDGRDAGALRATRIPAAVNSDQATRQTVGLMADYIRKCADDPLVKAAAKYAVDRFAMGNMSPAAKCWGVFWYVKHCVKFRLDEGALFEMGERDQQDLLTAPDVLLRMKKPAEDCDGFTMLVASMLRALDIPVVIATVAASASDPSRFSHVFPCALLPGQVLPLDASHGAYPGWMVPQESIYRWQAWDLDGRQVDVKPQPVLHGYTPRRASMLPGSVRHYRPRLGVLYRQSRGVRGLGDDTSATDGSSVTGTAPTETTLPVVVTQPNDQLTALLSALALQGENIVGRVVAPQYRQVCDSTGCTTVVAGGGPAAGAGTIPGVGVSSNVLLVGGGLLLLAALAFSGRGK